MTAWACSGEAEVAVVPGSHGGFNRIDELNDRIAAVIKARPAGQQPAQPQRRGAEGLRQDVA